MLTATLAGPQPAFKPPADAAVSVTLAGADLDLLLVALGTHGSRLCESWNEATARGGDAQAREVARLLGQVDHLARALREANRRRV